MKRPGSAWCLPGGNTDPGQHPKRTALRETREETCLCVDLIELVDAFLLPPGTEYDPHGAVTLVYRCVPISGELELSREGLALEWNHVDEVPEWFFGHGEYAEEAKRTI